MAATSGSPRFSILIPLEGQQDAREAVHLAEKLRMGGVEISRAGAAFEVDGRTYSAGTLVIPMTQVFARYVKDLREAQTYPEVRHDPLTGSDEQPRPQHGDPLKDRQAARRVVRLRGGGGAARPV